jgi:hypothetical protein
MGMSLPNALKKKNTTSKQISHRSSSDLGLGNTMPIEEELRQLLRSMRDSR